MQPLSRLLSPRAIVVVGGGTWCATVVAQCRESGFDGPVWPVHPTRTEIGGVPAYPSLDALPGVPDAAFVGVNRALSVDIVGQLARIGCGGAVCFAAGYAEAIAEMADGADLQAQLVAAAGPMRILGPNCYGLVNMLDRVALWPDRHGLSPLDSGVAIIGQSSNVLINLTMQRRGLPLAAVVAVGNQAQSSMADLGIALLEDPRITALGLHIEGITDLAAFEALATRARALGKPIVALKVGSSSQAQAAVVSHTASLVGSDVGARALLARLGMAQVETPAELVETLKLCHLTGGLPEATVASASCSGGEASLMADLGEKAGLSYPPLQAAQEAALRAVLGPKVALANPLDYNTYIWGDGDALGRCFTALAQGGAALTCVVLDMPRDDRFSAPDYDLVLDAMVATRKATGQALALVSMLPEGLSDALCARLIADGITPLCGMGEAVAAIRAAASVGIVGAAPAPVLLPGPEPEGGDQGKAPLSEAEAKALLSRAGLRVPQSRRAGSPEEAGAQAEQIGFPVVLKGEDIAHKTESGAVVLGLASAQDVQAAARSMPCDRFLVEEMVTGTVAELLLGVTRDPAHGFVLTLGLGGILTELIGDTVSTLVPSSRDEVRKALTRLRTGALLTGYRGRPSADTEAVLDAVMALQCFVTDHAAVLQEVEINPLMCSPTGAIAADALIRMGDPK
ncbi:acetate--CoA ligase family protein [Pseudooceanicola algae]|uniref:Trans-feruloyl-CoA synthase FCS1 n=1 Tax=Pseudooceanicola algae TaxID=1537215 RepID=A0A418SCX4_9RHOB|nr:acetate--CoA ligase family protein [Pseudooceanicola algae]QPM92360.1 Trans-feruloyl-CoA synthase FCS1 [Pseudooceanicola algae]